MLIKILFITNNNKHIRNITVSNMHCSNYTPAKLLLTKINKNVDNFSHLLDMRFSFFTFYRFMSYEFYLIQKCLCVKLN